MTTASSILPAAAVPTSSSSVTVQRRGPTILKRPRYHVVKKIHSTAKPVLLRNLRNYYARRRPSSVSINPHNKAQAAASSYEGEPEEEPNRKVQFYPRVRVKRIPSRLSYSQEDRLSMWVPKKELKQMVMKNHAESAFEGQDWQKAPEEEDFGERDGKLVHPFYVWAERTSGTETDQSEEEDMDDEESENVSSNNN